MLYEVEKQRLRLVSQALSNTQGITDTPDGRKSWGLHSPGGRVLQLLGGRWFWGELRAASGRLDSSRDCWARSKGGYKEIKEQVPLVLRKAIRTPFPSGDKSGQAKLEWNQVLREVGRRGKISTQDNAKNKELATNPKCGDQRSEMPTKKHAEENTKLK